MASLDNIFMLLRYAASALIFTGLYVPKDF